MQVLEDSDLEPAIASEMETGWFELLLVLVDRHGNDGCGQEAEQVHALHDGDEAILGNKVDQRAKLTKLQS